MTDEEPRPGDARGLVRRRAERAMAQAADELRFEDTGRLRDDLAALDAELERRT